jgi:phage protein U
MSLFHFGPISFEVYPFNVNGYTHEGSHDFAEKAVVGRRKPLEDVGAGDETYNFTGQILPDDLQGGLAPLAALFAVQSSGSPQPLARGDGTFLGWYVITKLSDKHSHLNISGVGRKVEFTMSLKRDDAPSPEEYFVSLDALI